MATTHMWVDLNLRGNPKFKPHTAKLNSLHQIFGPLAVFKQQTLAECGWSISRKWINNRAFPMSKTVTFFISPPWLLGWEDSVKQNKKNPSTVWPVFRVSSYIFFTQNLRVDTMGDALEGDPVNQAWDSPSPAWSPLSSLLHPHPHTTLCHVTHVTPWELISCF